MVLIKPKLAGQHRVPDEELLSDKKACTKIGSCGFGKRCLYLGSIFIDRYYYVPYEDIRRIWKRVAMSKGGFSGKGIFASMAYVVVQLKDKKELSCYLKHESDVDALLARIKKAHPQIPILSKEAEEKLKAAEREEQKKYLATLSKEAQNSIDALMSYKKDLDKTPEVYERLAKAAQQKRVIDNINPTYKVAALVIFILALISAVSGLYLLLKKNDFALYFVLFGIAFIFTIMATGVLPSGKNNKKFAERQWFRALNASQKNIERIKDFPLPAQYAHPIVIERMIRAIRMGRCKEMGEALELVKEDLKALNAGVSVSQKEYDEVVAIKPLFLVMNYN